MPNDNNKGMGFSEQPPPRTVSLDYKVVSKVNFASAQNDVAIIERFAIDNPTDESLVDVRVTLRAAPPIVREKIWSVDRIAQGSDLALRDLSTPLDIERLAGLDEAEVGELEFRVEAQGVDTIVEKCRIDLLARDEWGGVGDMAQILAAFVSPNDPTVAGVLKEAARLLEAAGHDGSLNGYQSGDPRRAYRSWELGTPNRTTVGNLECLHLGRVDIDVRERVAAPGLDGHLGLPNAELVAVHVGGREDRSRRVDAAQVADHPNPVSVEQSRAALLDGVDRLLPQVALL